jgi:hypothetical protein
VADIIFITLGASFAPSRPPATDPLVTALPSCSNCRASLAAQKQAVWDQHQGSDFLPTEVLLDALNHREDWPWGAWNNGEGLRSSQLAAQLKVFDVHSKQRRVKPNLFVKSKPTRGYERSSFEKAWQHFILIAQLHNGYAEHDRLCCCTGDRILNAVLSAIGLIDGDVGGRDPGLS